MLDYMVLYQSETGNTKKLATSIFAALPGMAKDLRRIDELSSLPEGFSTTRIFSPFFPAPASLLR